MIWGEYDPSLKCCNPLLRMRGTVSRTELPRSDRNLDRTRKSCLSARRIAVRCGVITGRGNLERVMKSTLRALLQLIAAIAGRGIEMRITVKWLAREWNLSMDVAYLKRDLVVVKAHEGGKMMT